MSATPWATVSDVSSLVGATVTEAQIRQAVTSLEVQIGLIQDVPRTEIRDRDRYFLKIAVCYQAAWIAAQADLLERSLVTAASQDGESASFTMDSLTLAPLARLAIRRLSWKGRRTIGPGRAPSLPVNINSDEYEETLNWRPV